MIVTTFLVAGGAFLWGVRALNRYFDAGSEAADPPGADGADASEVGEGAEPGAQSDACAPEDAARQALLDSATAPSCSLRRQERELHHSLSLSLGSLGLATAGLVLFPPLRLLSSAATLYAALPIHRRAYQAIVQERRLHPALIESLATLGAVLSGYAVAGAAATALYFGGRKLLLQAQAQGLPAGDKPPLHRRGFRPPATVFIARGETEVEIPLSTLQLDDIVVVGAGQVIPIAGRVHAGWALVEVQSPKGEVELVERGPGAAVLPASLVREGSLQIVVQSVAAALTAPLAPSLRCASDAWQQPQWSSGELADHALAPQLGLSILGYLQRGLGASTAVLSANFADNLQVAVPLAALAARQRALSLGVLIRDRRALPSLGQVDTVVLDLSAGRLGQPLCAEEGLAGVSAGLMALRQRGLRLCLVSGESESVTEHMAQQLGIAQYHANLVPAAKAAVLRQLTQAGHRVCFVGDCSQAGLPGDAAEVAVAIPASGQSADDPAAVVLLDGSLRGLPPLFAIAGDFAEHTQAALYLNAGGALLCIGGVFGLGLGIHSALLLRGLALAGSVLTATRQSGAISGESLAQAAAPVLTPQPVVFTAD